jgi:P27 family predicted phage terminase small subunit
MGLRGLPKTPTSLAKLRGTNLHRVNEDEPKPVPGWPDPPVDMSMESTRIWDDLRSAIEHTEIVTLADRDLLRAYCDTVVRTRQLQKMSEEVPLVIEEPVFKKGAGTGRVGRPPKDAPPRDDGKWTYVLRPHPVVKMLQDSITQQKMLAREFGLTPGGRPELRSPATARQRNEPGEILDGISGI